jgi:ABC-2 type transport system ATP-binding protein
LPKGLRKNFELEIDVDRLVDALDILSRNNMESAVFGSMLHVTIETAASGEPEIRRLLSDAGITIRKIEKIVPSLEDVFVTLIETA